MLGGGGGPAIKASTTYEQQEARKMPEKLKLTRRKLVHWLTKMLERFY